jgi:hypothetical protein
MARCVALALALAVCLPMVIAEAEETTVQKLEKQLAKDNDFETTLPPVPEGPGYPTSV